MDTRLLKDIAKLVEEQVESKISEISKHVKNARAKLTDNNTTEKLTVLKDFLSSNTIKQLLRDTEREFLLYELLENGSHFRMSQFLGTCLRKQLFMFFKCKVIDEHVLGSYAESRIHTLIGETVHRFIQEILGIQYSEVEIEFEPVKGFKLLGHIDLIYAIQNKQHKAVVVADIKTIKITKYQRQKNFIGLPSHWQQVFTYAYALESTKLHEKIFNMPLKFAQLIYITKELEIVDDIIVNLETSSTYKKMKTVIDNKASCARAAIETQKIPPPSTEYFVNFNDCRFCPYQSFCKNNPDFITVTNKHFNI